MPGNQLQGIQSTKICKYQHNNLGIHSFCCLCLTEGPQPLPKQVLHTVRSSASSSNFQSSCHFCSITCCGRQFLCNMWPWSSAFLTHCSVDIPHTPNHIFSYTLLRLFFPDIYIPLLLWTDNLLTSAESVCYISAVLLSSVDNRIFLVLHSNVFTLGQLISHSPF